MLNKIKSTFLDILYPRHCPVCHEIIGPGGQKVCVTCKDKLQPAAGPRCFKCSKPLDSEEQEYCRDCMKPRQFDQGIGIFSYGSILRESLFKLKYGKRQEYGVFYGQFAAFYSRERIAYWGIDVIIPIPLHRRRLEKRGYNQAEIIAQAMGRKLGIPIDSRVLKRRVNTKPQKDLSSRERKRNMENAFVVREKMSYARVLLVDDIYTTGATVEAAAEVLTKAGAQRVYFLTIAIGAELT